MNDVEELRKKADKAWKLERILGDLFDTLEKFTYVIRSILYVGSVAFTWFYLKEKAMAVVIGSSLTLAHLSMAFLDYIREKKNEVLNER